jgi:pimeloyl-ACP methyl ester carboxylesterase
LIGRRTADAERVPVAEDFLIQVNLASLPARPRQPPRCTRVRSVMTLNSSVQSRRLSPPSKWLAAAEFPRAIAEAGLFTAALPSLLPILPRGDGHPVIVLPGLLAGDNSTAMLRASLRLLGHRARGWGLGRNFGPRSIGADGRKLTHLVDAAFEETERKVSLVGWSLGGVLARIAARRVPAKVRQVITLGSPFAAERGATHADRLFEAANGPRLRDPRVRALRDEMRRPLAVPSTAIFSKSDGVCSWQGCVAPPGAHSENVEVPGSHCGLGANPFVLYVVADRLAQSEGDWARFHAGGASWLFPAGQAQ